MAAGGPEREDETLQTAFKKLRVDANSALATPGGPESPRAAAGDVGPAKAKHGASKDNWHGCVRKASRGASRTQRRRRSKSPILHLPRFTYSSATPPPPRTGGLKQRAELGPASPAGAAPPELPAAAPPSELPGRDEGGPGNVQGNGGADSTNFGLLSKRRGGPCACSPVDGAAPCCCASKGDAWGGVGAYSFTGLRDVISECERHSPAPSPAGPAPSSASPRSCSSQALVSVDDVTMEDLAGYVEFYLYIPKKMSHMAEMMYT
ncbi:oxidative stress-responsive serine-rich protein 1 [Vanacampus margaritifer]